MRSCLHSSDPRNILINIMENNQSIEHEVDAGNRLTRGLERARNAGLTVFIGSVALYTELAVVEEVATELEATMVVSAVVAAASEAGRWLVGRQSDN
jgi:hypothetical protein